MVHFLAKVIVMGSVSDKYNDSQVEEVGGKCGIFRATAGARSCSLLAKTIFSSMVQFLKHTCKHDRKRRDVCVKI